MKVTVYGAGYVGLVQAAVFAEVGHDVLCVDIDADKIAALELGKLPMFEPDLDELISRVTTQNRLRFSADPLDGVMFARWQFLAVGTPSLPTGGADLSAVRAVVGFIADHMLTDKIVVHKSTVPVGTADAMQALAQDRLLQRGVDLMCEVVSNPEFLKEGCAVGDCRKPDRIIVGTEDPQLQRLFAKLYAPFNRNHDKLMFMDVRSAELTKYAANAFLATKISFMNEMANLAESLGGDIESVRKGMGGDPRIGHHFLYAGCGFGGSCFPKDIRALTALARAQECPTALLDSVEKVNQQQKHRLFERLWQHFRGQLSGKTVAVWGLSFKPNTSDVREAPSLMLIESLLAVGVHVQAFDPQGMDEHRAALDDSERVCYCESKEAALAEADALVVCTEWRDFWSPDLALMKRALRQCVIVDGRNVFDPETVRSQGFVYYGIGRA